MHIFEEWAYKSQWKSKWTDDTVRPTTKNRTTSGPRGQLGPSAPPRPSGPPGPSGEPGPSASREPLIPDCSIRSSGVDTTCATDSTPAVYPTSMPDTTPGIHPSIMGSPPGVRLPVGPLPVSSPMVDPPQVGPPCVAHTLGGLFGHMLQG